MTELGLCKTEVQDWGIAYILNEALSAMNEAAEYRTFCKEARDLLTYAANSIQACLEADPSERMLFAAEAVKEMQGALKGMTDA